ncbi:hypothetical protein BMF94_6612 [Rhodotorula taiwanensis]|uniref:AP complex mu/sigma subunit domain-containing protein n=1 Tax=Rhodotorula taiwanensis TaxID=741276 RepID=A0A2S5B0L4_9BASI|nr:hypothetical protein BMF94_6612 [Rhodotorula taiwanensis]
MIHGGPESTRVCPTYRRRSGYPVLIFNNAGKPRLTKFYSPSSPKTRAAILQRIYSLVSVRDDSLCNFVDLPPGFGFGETGEKEHAGDDDLRVIYRHYATLYFVFVVDQSESELGILDLIQVFVESLDRCFENVCELDLIFHFDDIHTLLNCIITGGLVLDTSLESIHSTFKAQQDVKKASQNGGGLSVSGLKDAAGGFLAAGDWDRLSFANLTRRGR